MPASILHHDAAAVRAQPPSGPTAAPVRLGSFELLRRLGGGELTSVFLARAAGGGGDQLPAYAVKVLRPEWQDDSRAVELLAREAQVSRCVAHPHLVPVLATSLAGPPFYVAMPLLEGSSLAQLLAAEVPLDLPLALWIARQTAEALGALAAGGWMHGDVKPSNVVVAPWGHATLVDLGFATPADAHASIVERPLVGTLSYIAPELLCSSTGGDPQSDIYSLGVMLFEMLTDRLPFDARDAAELALQHRQDLPSDVRSLVPHVPVKAARLVHQMLAKDPLRRPAATEVVERLMALEIETFGERFACEAA